MYRPTTSRLFFALLPDRDVRDRLAAATQDAVQNTGGRPVPLQNLHVTLAFLGSVDAERVPELKTLAGAVQPPSFELVFDRIELWRRSGVLCATPTQQADDAVAWVQQLWSALRTIGFEPDSKPWHAHVTLVRDAVELPVDHAIAPVRWPVKSFALIESQPRAHGPEYVVLHRWP